MNLTTWNCPSALFFSLILYMDNSIGPHILISEFSCFSTTLLKMYKIKHLTTQSRFSNTCESLSCSKEPTEVPTVQKSSALC